MHRGGIKLTLKMHHLPFLALHLITVRNLLQGEIMGYILELIHNITQLEAHIRNMS